MNSSKAKRRTPPKVALFSWSIPHYRAPLFRRLTANPNLNFTVYAGETRLTPTGGTVATIDDVNATEDLRWHKLSSRHVTIPILRGLEWQPDAVTIAKTENFDAVITFGIRSVSNWLLRRVLSNRGIPILEWGQGLKAPEAGLKWMIRKRYLKRAKAQLLYGTWARDFFANHGFRRDELFVVRNSLDHQAQVALRKEIIDEKIQDVRSNYGIENNRTRLVVHSGRLEKRKHIHLLIEAMSILRKQDIDVVAVLIGDGPEHVNLDKLARERGVADQIVWLGACYDERVIAELFCASDLCVAPGAVGLLAMHSLVYGTPILTSYNTTWSHGPEVETVIEAHTGGYFAPHSATGLASKMKKMLFPKPCKIEMADACRKIIDDFYTPEYQEKMFIKAINSVLPTHRQIESAM